jgi:hypothetical protein
MNEYDFSIIFVSATKGTVNIVIAKMKIVNIIMLMAFDVYFQDIIAIPADMNVKPTTIEKFSEFPDRNDNIRVLKNGMQYAIVLVKTAFFSELTRFHK